MDLISEINQLPSALEAVYLTPEINQNIQLYKGELQIDCKGIVSAGIGSISYEWFPIRALKFQVELTTENKDHLINNLLKNNSTCSTAKLSIPKNEKATSFTLENCNPFSSKISGYICKEGFSISLEDKLSYVICHIANLYQCCGTKKVRTTLNNTISIVNRHILEANGWKLTIDDTGTLQEHEKQLNTQGGFAITHVARLEKSDAQEFSGTDAREFLSICSDFLSFSRGFRISIFLLAGFNQNEEETWKHWEPSSCNPWQYTCSWLPIRKHKSLSTAFSGFVKLHSAWGKSFKILLNEYLESNANGRFIENSIILTQVALELASWKILVKENDIITEVDFKNLPASDGIRKLLSHYDIPLKIPPDCIDCLQLHSSHDQNSLIPELNAFLRESNKKWDDGPHVLTAIRNNIVHPKKDSELSSASLEVLFQARILGIWYLEMILLARMGYTGCYANRLIIPRDTGNYDSVPWRKSDL